MHFKRTLDLNKLLKKKFFFLFGPRSTGKSTLISKQLKKAVVYDLLDHETYLRLLKRPKILEEENTNNQKIIVIDEIQLQPNLLNEVHRLISKNNKTFLLTGSSSRKLKKRGINLLAGRAWLAELMPLSFSEIHNFELLQYLNRGGLPHIYTSEDFKEELKAYCSLYLKEEIQAEALTRNLQAFSSFLEVMAINDGEEVNFQSLASDCGVPASTIKNYIQILKDTFLGFSLEGYTKTKKRKAISRIKHYFFDLGVANHLSRKEEIKNNTYEFEKNFEHFIIQELRAYLSYQRLDLPLCYWRSHSQFEVDATVGDKMAVEIKSSTFIQDKHLKGLRAIKEENIFEKYIVVSQDKKYRKTSAGIEIYPWKLFLEKLWKKQLL